MDSLDIFNPLGPADLQQLTPGSRQDWGGLQGSTLGLCIAACQRQYEGLLLVLTENPQQAERLRSELEFFCRQAMQDDSFLLQEFPDWETLPYDNFSPHQDIISQRLSCLHHLPDIRRGILILPVSTLMHRLPPPAYVRGRSLLLQRGQQLDFADLRRQLERSGYHYVDTVCEHGEFTVRGAIMDLFPMGASQPYRIELFDTEIESLRSFDPDTQISSGSVDEIRMLPGKEYPLDEAGIARFRQRFRESFDLDLRRCPLYEDVSQGIATAGIEYYLPLFFDELHSLLDYLPEQTLLITCGQTAEGAELFWREASSRYQDRSIDKQRPVLPPEQVFIPVNELFGQLRKLPALRLHTETGAGRQHRQLQLQSLPDLDINHKLAEPLQALQNFIAAHEDTPVLLCADSPGRRESLLDLLRQAQLQPQVLPDWESFLAERPALAITVAPLESGFLLQEPPLAVISENQLFTHYVPQRRRREKRQDNSDFIIKSLTELREGAAVVHIDHGVGRYRGLQSFDVEGQGTEFLVLEYAEGAKLYVPVASLHLISRYSGADPESAPLHKLGSDQWQRAKRKAAEKVIDVAAELLDIYARREARSGIAFRLPEHEYPQFANSFPFEETEDQSQAIARVLEDMARPRAMDRLICGDVGFGKTEVALRAAFIAVQNHCQVAVLVPTTLLAQQHYDNFRDRFADWPVRIALMSRFVDNVEQEKHLQELASGKIDIVIGTHKLLQPSIKYSKLGLLIIDEEHRFGVRQKEQLKAMRANVDILTLTATPIPRTLNMAMSGMRDLSIIASPPARRLAIKTFVRESQPALIKEAILRELLRGGQVFFLHNEVKSIEKSAEELRALIPEARVAVAHGQLRERELERVMSEFYHKHYNVLVCSTIIETGIDIPNANTIIIEQADKLGLAQLHQLRGRVGRSHHQAYAYLLTRPSRSMTADAKKRIEAIEAASTLGAGFTLASHDLEIRGAGELLGDEQSGHIQTIGFTLYSEMLEQTIRLMKAGKQPNLDQPLQQGTEINLRVPALIPDDYLPDVHLRLLMYKRIANARSDHELRELKVEMIDRFGLLPVPLQNLFAVTELKLLAEQLGIRKIEAGSNTGKICFTSSTPVDPYTIIRLVQEQAGRYTLSGATELRFRHQEETAQGKIELVRSILRELSPAGMESKGSIARA